MGQMFVYFYTIENIGYTNNKTKTKQPHTLWAIKWQFTTSYKGKNEQLIFFSHINLWFIFQSVIVHKKSESCSKQ